MASVVYILGLLFTYSQCLSNYLQTTYTYKSLNSKKHMLQAHNPMETQYSKDYV